MWWAIAVMALCFLAISVWFNYRLDCIENSELSNLKRHCALLQERVEVLQDALGKGHNKIESMPDLDAGYAQAAFSDLGSVGKKLNHLPTQE